MEKMVGARWSYHRPLDFVRLGKTNHYGSSDPSKLGHASSTGGSVRFSIMLLHELYIHTAVKGGVPKLGNCLKMYMWWPNCAHHVYKLKHSLYTGATAWPFLVHWSCIHAWELAWAHVYTSKQFPSLGTPTLTAVTAMSPVPDVCKFEV